MQGSDHPEAPALPAEEIVNQASLCQLVGFCLAQFSKVEESLAALFGTVAAIPSMESAFRINDQIREFRYRLDATHSVVTAWIGTLQDQGTRDAMAKEWSVIRKSIKGESEDRNRIAHFSLAPNDNDDGTVTWYVCPYFQPLSHLSALREQGDKLKIPDAVKKFDVAALEAMLKRFAEAGRRLDKFINTTIEHGAKVPT